MGSGHPRVFVEIVAKKKGCMLCDLAVAILEEIAEDFDEGVLGWEIVDMGDREGLKRHEVLTRLCGGKPAVPSIVINEKIAFDHIPDMEALTQAVKKASGNWTSRRWHGISALAWKRRFAMEPVLTENERDRVHETIRQRYHKVAESPEGHFRYPTGRAGLEALGYEQALMEKLPESVLRSYCGVGNPFSLVRPREGETVLDIGCGAGVDVFMAALMIGSTGRAVGIDMVPEMIEKARQNLEETKLENVTLELGSAEKLPFPDGGFDAVISNGVFNLIPDKRSALREVLRVLKPGGRLQMADQVLTSLVLKDKKALIDSWSQWEGGALPGKDFLAVLEETGFGGVELVKETGFNSTPNTKGVLIRAGKEAALKMLERRKGVDESLKKYQAFFDEVYAEGALGRKTKHLIALGASLAAGCQPWTQYCLAVARELGTTDEELK